MASEDPTLAELGISGRAAGVLSEAGLKTRSQLEAFGLERIQEIKGIGGDYAEEIRAKVAASHDEGRRLEEAEASEVAEPDSKVAGADTAGAQTVEAKTVGVDTAGAQSVEEETVGADTAEGESVGADNVVPEPVDQGRLERATLVLAAGILGHPAAGPLLTPPFHREADLARKARVLAEAVIREIDRDDGAQGAE
jgi:hypothetical protein